MGQDVVVRLWFSSSAQHSFGLALSQFRCRRGRSGASWRSDATSRVFLCSNLHTSTRLVHGHAHTHHTTRTQVLTAIAELQLASDRQSVALKRLRLQLGLLATPAERGDGEYCSSIGGDTCNSSVGHPPLPPAAGSLVESHTAALAELQCTVRERLRLLQTSACLQQRELSGLATQLLPHGLR